MKLFSVRHPCVPALSTALAIVLVCAGCSWFKRADGLVGISTISLAPALRLSPSVTTASVSFQNACGQAASFPLAALLADAVPRKLKRVFSGIVLAEPAGGPPNLQDGVIEVGLGLKQIDLAITRQVNRKHPVTVTLGVDAAFFGDDGTRLFDKKVQSSGHGAVEVTEQSCDVKGLESAVQEAVELVTEGMARQLAESIRVREFAERRRGGSPAPVAVLSGDGFPVAAASKNPPAAEPVAGKSPGLAAPSVDTQGPAAEPTQPVPALAFRAIVRDDNRDQILQQEEALTIEIEVKNQGPTEVKGVEVLIGGSSAVTAQFPSILPVGDLEPGEIKRTSMTKPIGKVQEPVRGELMLSLRSATPVAALPLAKKFTAFLKPERADAVEPVPDVDQPPKPVPSLKQPKAVVIAIGVGRFRDEQVPPVKYAGRDAEVMAGYLRAIGGVPDDRVRVLVDDHALKQDLAETFDEWLLRRADPATVAYVFFSGRALVDGVTGAVSLVPFDGTTSAVNRLFSVRRLQEALSRASIQRAVVMLDVSLEPVPGTAPATHAQPNWNAGGGERKDQTMWMVGSKSLQEAHAYEQGRHGLFTYHLLRGLQGLADADRDGIVAAGELCAYARGQVARMARDQFGNEQDPVCLPPPGQGAMIRIHPLAKGDNLKPAAPVKKPDSGGLPSQSPKPSGQEPGP